MSELKFTDCRKQKGSVEMDGHMISVELVPQLLNTFVTPDMPARTLPRSTSLENIKEEVIDWLSREPLGAERIRKLINGRLVVAKIRDKRESSCS